MVQLIVLIMAIMLTSYAVMAGISYFDFSTLKAREGMVHWTSFNLAMAESWSEILMVNYRRPEAVEELLANANSIAPPSGLSLTAITSDFPGWCLSGSVQSDGYKALQRLSQDFPQHYGVSSSCGSTGGIDQLWQSSLDEATYPIPVTVTYRLSLQ